MNLFADMARRSRRRCSRVSSRRRRRPTRAAPTSAIIAGPTGGDAVSPAPRHRHRHRDATPAAVASRASRCRPTTAPTWHPASGHESWSYTFTPADDRQPDARRRATDDSVNTGPRVDGGRRSTVAPHGCPCTIWDNSATPASRRQQRRPVPIDYGVKFRSDVDGVVTGFRFYKSPGDTGTHIGPPVGRQRQPARERDVHRRDRVGMAAGRRSASPVAITADTTYIGSIFSSAGFYPVDSRRTSRARASTIRRCTRSQTGSTDRTPSTTRAATRSRPAASTPSNYWADVVFSNGPDTTPPVVTARQPDAGATDVPVTRHGRPRRSTSRWTRRRSRPRPFTLRDASNALVAGLGRSTTRPHARRRSRRARALVAVGDVHATVTGGPSGVADVAGNPMSADVVVVVHDRPRRRPTTGRADRFS